MAVQYFKLKHAGRTANVQGYEEKRTLTYLAKMDSANDTEESVVAAGPFFINSVYSYAGNTVLYLGCDRISLAQQAGADSIWTITYEFSKRIPGQLPDPQQVDPTLRTPKYSMRKEKREKIIWKDKHSTPKAIVNSAGGRFSKALTEPRSRLVVTCTRNEATYNLATMVSYWDTVNGFSFWGNSAYHCLMESITAQRVWERVPGGTAGFWEITYEIHIDRDDIRTTEILDEGAFYLADAGGGAKVKALPKDKGGIPHTGTILLDGSGGQLSEADVLAGNVHYLQFWTKDAVDWAPLALSPPS